MTPGVFDVIGSSAADWRTRGGGGGGGGQGRAGGVKKSLIRFTKRLSAKRAGFDIVCTFARGVDVF